MWAPHPNLDSTLVPVIHQAIELIPARHLQPTKPQETFNTVDTAYERLQNWAFSQGFCVVIYSHVKDVMMHFSCKHYSDET